MKMITRFYPILFFLIGSLLAVGNPGDADNLDQHQMNVKAIEEYQAAEIRLGKVYNKLLADERSALQKEKLIASQKAWIVYRDAVLAEKFPDDDRGSGTPQFYNEFAKMLTEERIAVLKYEI